MATVVIADHPETASAAEVIAPFNTVSLVANPNSFTIGGLANTINGSTTGTDFARIFTGQGPATGVVIDYAFTSPKHQLTRLQLFNNGGVDLNDADGIGSALLEVFDPTGALLFTGTLNAGNGGAAFDTLFPTPLDNVTRVRLSNITNLLPAAGAAPDIIWRELRALQHVSTPSIATSINADGYSDDVTVTGSEDLDGTLTWTLFGPVGPGADGTCASATWASAPTFQSGTVPVLGDGVAVATPTSPPTVPGCYSYADVLAGPYYTASATSPVGLVAETFGRPATPTLATTINADGFSDDVTIRGTIGFAGTLTWTLLGPVDAGPSGTCSDADYSTAPTNASGFVPTIGDLEITTTPPTDPSAPGCYTYEVTLSGPLLDTVIHVRGQPAETVARPSTPALSTTINQDRWRDDVVVTGTAGFAGMLTWTLYGPATQGPSGTCADAEFDDAPIVATGTLAVAGDGTYITAPPAPPTADGCYSYAQVLDGPDFTSEAISEVGQAAETFVVPIPPPPPPATTSTTTTTLVATTVVPSDPAPTTTLPAVGPPSTFTPTSPAPPAAPLLLPATGGHPATALRFVAVLAIAGLTLITVSRTRRRPLD